MLKYKILKAINEGINKSLIDFANQEDIQFNKSDVKHATEMRINDYVFIYDNFVDLDLPSGTLWAKHNLGATNERNAKSWYGDKYSWGEIKTKQCYDYMHYTMKHLLSNNNPLQIKDDVFCKVMEQKMKKFIPGSVCHIPSDDDFMELINNTNISWQTNYNGINDLNGYLFIGKNKNELFIPATESEITNYKDSAYLWTSSSASNDESYYFNFILYNIKMQYSSNKWNGFNIRGVCYPN